MIGELNQQQPTQDKGLFIEKIKQIWERMPQEKIQGYISHIHLIYEEIIESGGVTITERKKRRT